MNKFNDETFKNVAFKTLNARTLMMNIAYTKEKLFLCFSKDTCYHGSKERWTKNNPSLGHCAVASMIIQELYGGQIAKTTVKRSTHYFNIIDNEIIDITSEQFGDIVIDYSKCEMVDGKKILKCKEVKERLTLLKQKFALVSGICLI